jgi:aldehyde:ferredoxin oxidoreductase
MDAMVKEYYAYRGWSDSGLPLPEMIEKLDLETV